MNRPRSGRPPGPRLGHEPSPDPEQPYFVVIQRRGKAPHACVGPMDIVQADRARASWRSAGYVANVTRIPIGTNLTNELEGA